MRIAVDAMGGDFAPASAVKGAVDAAKQYNLEIVLVGDKTKVEEELSKHKFSPESITVHHASEVIQMNESAAVAVRRKRDASICRAIDLVKEKKADAFVSAGNTGAVVCAAMIFLRNLAGVERPGIGIVIPTLKGESLFIDAGANIASKPVHLLQYAIMADAYLRYVLGKNDPTVGLLNIGEEEVKGTGFIKDAYALLEQSKINFIGNVEGKDIYSGECDCIVCDGFVGNVALKVSESMAHAIMEFLKREIKSSLLGRITAPILKKILSNFKKDIDYSEYGGAPLLGVNGVVIIAHGHSSPNAIKNAIRVAMQEVSHDINGKIMEAIN